LLTLAVIPFGKRRPAGKPVSWGEAMFGSAYAFAIMFLAYGVVPHQFLTWADSELNWRPDVIWFGPTGQITLPFDIASLDTPWFPIQISARAVRDIVATLIYVVFLGLQMWMWAWWQKRGDNKAGTELATSTFGRPLVKKG
jgi:hypothetical protein